MLGVLSLWAGAAVLEPVAGLAVGLVTVGSPSDTLKGLIILHQALLFALASRQSMNSREGTLEGTLCPAQADDDLDAGHFHALGQVGDAQARGGHVDDLALFLQEEMVMLGRVGVEIGLGPVHRQLAQEAD